MLEDVNGRARGPDGPERLLAVGIRQGVHDAHRSKRSVLS